jgi:hypothetical protein
MTLTLDLPQDVESRLAVEARQLGLTLEAYALQLLSEATAPAPPLKTGADVVAYWEREGLIGTRPDIIDSVEFARENRARAERRGRE